MERISDIASEDTEETTIYNLPNMNQDKNLKIIGRKFDWTKLYGKLNERRV